MYKRQSVKRVIVGVVINTVLTVLMAYPLSKSVREFPARRYYVWLLIFAMIFDGGLIPNYLQVKNLNLFDTISVSYTHLAMQAIEHQEWSYRLSEEEPAEFQYVFRQYNQMVNQIEILIRQVYEKQVQTEQARRKQLQAQINPHFLYNSFYMGYQMCIRDRCCRRAIRYHQL